MLSNNLSCLILRFPSLTSSNEPAKIPAFPLLFKSFEEMKFSAVGEIGIDLYWNKKNLKNQINVFTQQIELALSNKLPIVIHCREAFDEVYKVLLNFKKDNLFGIFHCFTGTKEKLKK